VDDNLVIRAVVRSLLHRHSFDICGEAKDGNEAIEKVIELTPDVVLLDIDMPVMEGIKAAVEIRRIAPATKIVFFTNHDFPTIVDLARPLADGLVFKSAAIVQLIPTLNRILGIAPDDPMKSRGASGD
jgi:DNA-binding NarL/FixJ family response regulator